MDVVERGGANRCSLPFAILRTIRSRLLLLVATINGSREPKEVCPRRPPSYSTTIVYTIHTSNRFHSIDSVICCLHRDWTTACTWKRIYRSSCPAVQQLCTSPAPCMRTVHVVATTRTFHLSKIPLQPKGVTTPLSRLSP